MATREVFGTAGTGTTWAVDTAIYAAADTVGPIAPAPIQFILPAVDAGRRAVIRSLRIVDPDANIAANQVSELWLFNSTVTPAAGNAAHSISDADAAKCIGVISIAAANAFLSALNTVVSVPNLYLPFIVSGSTLFGILVTRATPTNAGGFITIGLTIDGLD